MRKVKKKESMYTLKKKIKKLESENMTLKDDMYAFRSIVRDIFDRVVSCDSNEHIPMLKIIKLMRPLVIRTREE